MQNVSGSSLEKCLMANIFFANIILRQIVITYGMDVVALFY